MFLRAQVTLKHDTGLAEDHFVNTFHFDSDNAVAGTAEKAGLAARLNVFYQALAPQMASVLSGELDVKIYNMADPEPRVPIYVETFTGMAVGSTSLPEEVAMCLSYHAAPVSGENQRRKRGRIFLGPISSTQNVVTSGRARPSDAFRGVALAAMANLVEGLGAGDPRLAVFSPTILATTAGDLDAAYSDVVEVSVDNAWDIQRKRGAVATLKETTAV